MRTTSPTTEIRCKCHVRIHPYRVKSKQPSVKLGRPLTVCIASQHITKKSVIAHCNSQRVGRIDQTQIIGIQSMRIGKLPGIIQIDITPVPKLIPPFTRLLPVFYQLDWLLCLYQPFFPFFKWWLRSVQSHLEMMIPASNTRCIAPGDIGSRLIHPIPFTLINKVPTAKTASKRQLFQRVVKGIHQMGKSLLTHGHFKHRLTLITMKEGQLMHFSTDWITTRDSSFGDCPFIRALLSLNLFLYNPIGDTPVLIGYFSTNPFLTFHFHMYHRPEYISPKLHFHPITGNGHIAIVQPELLPEVHRIQEKVGLQF